MDVTDRLTGIASQFKIQGKIESIHEFGDGHINDSYYVKTVGGADPDYILQRKNKKVFHPVPEMMNNIFRVTSHLKKKIEAKGGNPFKESMTLYPSHNGDYFYHDHHDEFWAICLFIPDHIIFQKADSPEIAFKGGSGIGEFQFLLSDLTDPLTDILPGFHNIRHRFVQWDGTLQKDPLGRKSKLATEISWIRNRRKEMLDFWELIENGVIPERVAHNDTKINNILFDKEGKVLCMIDLDTVMNSSVLNDFGDAVRTYANTGLEDDRDTGNVSMDFGIFKALSEGYLQKANAFLTAVETDHLAFSARYIIFEQVLRFLMDFIDGDTYYKIRYEDHNLIRARAQYFLLQSIENQYEKMKDCISAITRSIRIY
jgi:hypothetical protein